MSSIVIHDNKEEIFVGIVALCGLLGKYKESRIKLTLEPTAEDPNPQWEYICDFEEFPEDFTMNFRISDPVDKYCKLFWSFFQQRCDVRARAKLGHRELHAAFGQFIFPDVVPINGMFSFVMQRVINASIVDANGLAWKIKKGSRPVMYTNIILRPRIEWISAPPRFNIVEAPRHAELIPDAAPVLAQPEPFPGEPPFVMN